MFTRLAARRGREKRESRELRDRPPTLCRHVGVEVTGARGYLLEEDRMPRYCLAGAGEAPPGTRRAAARLSRMRQAQPWCRGMRSPRRANTYIGLVHRSAAIADVWRPGSLPHTSPTGAQRPSTIRPSRRRAAPGMGEAGHIRKRLVDCEAQNVSFVQQRLGIASDGSSDPCLIG